MTRARAFLVQLGIEKETAILTSSQFAENKNMVGDSQIIPVDECLSNDINKFQRFLTDTFQINNCKKLFLDAFPFGIVGEFEDFEFGDLEVFSIARLLKWSEYSNGRKVVAKRLAKTFILENIEADQMDFIKKNSAEIEFFELKYEANQTRNQNEIENIINNHKPFWLVVHAGNESETRELFEYANDIRELEKADTEIVLISPNVYGLENTYDLFPASDLFPFAEKIFTACGFNSMKQTERFREKHLFLPFERRFDDQFARAAFARAEFASKTRKP